MGLSPGTRLGAYEIVGLLGAGGMGEVYRAVDGRLGRQVALKVLPEAVASDPERIARFQREAKILASVTHPHIAALFGLEEDGSGHFLTMELVEGETLAERIARGPLPVDQALTIAIQVADALEAAHESGIVHRDLKPANIKVTADDRVKVLDFGLARTVETAAVGASLSNSPTFSVAATQAGIILGTAAYMAPEQAKGLPVDHRADIFAFGVVLYEILTGRNPFQGDTAAEVLASVLVRDPDLTALPSNLNSRLTDLLRRCLNKSPRKRWQAIGDLRVELEAIATAPRATAGTTPVEKRRLRLAIPVGLAALVSAAITGGVVWTIWPATPPRPIVERYIFPLGEGQNFSNTGRQAVAISPDGARMVYVANTRLYLRSMSELEARPIPGAEAEAGLAVTNPVFSPDGQAIVFWAGINTQTDGSLKRIAVTGGVPVALSEARNPYGLSWIDDEILVGQGPSGIMRLPANGGKPDVLITVSGEERAHGPQMLPGKQAVLFTLVRGTSVDWDAAKIVVQQLRTGERKTIIEAGSDARYLPSGHLVYALGGTVFGVRFDPRRLEVLGAPVPIIEGVRRGGSTGTAHFSTSSAGSLVYIPGPTLAFSAIRDIVLLDRSGSIERLKLPPGAYEDPRISPDGKQIAFSKDDGKERAIWVYDVSGTTAPRQLTVGGNNQFPVWSSDGRRVAFQSDRDGDFAIFWQPVDGTGSAERLTKPEKGVLHTPESWNPKSDTLLFRVATEQNKFSLWTISTEEKKLAPLGGVQSTSAPNAVFSPDGHWVAYYSDEAGGDALWLQPFPATGVKTRLPPDGDNHHPLWSPDGRELLYVRGQNQLSLRSIKTSPMFSFGNPAQVPVPTGTERIFLNNPTTHRTFDITRAGKIVGLTNLPAPGTPTTPQIHVVLNWFEEMKRLVPIR